MTSLHRIGLFLGSALLTGTLACGGASTPTAGDESAGSELNSSGAQVCDATPAPTARCAAACPYGYAGASGTHSCECCGAPEGPDAGAGEVCGGPPANARCMACPGDGNGYKQIDGQPTCECCTGAPVADAGADAHADAGEICGGPPPNARCKACPSGASGYKQIDGQPTCECCSS